MSHTVIVAGEGSAMKLKRHIAECVRSVESLSPSNYSLYKKIYFFFFLFCTFVHNPPGPTSQDAETPSHPGFHPPHLLYNRRGLTRNNSEFRRPTSRIFKKIWTLGVHVIAGILGHLWGPLTILYISKMWGHYWLHLTNRK
jgi:hypothetical protein